MVNIPTTDAVKEASGRRPQYLGAHDGARLREPLEEGCAGSSASALGGCECYSEPEDLGRTRRRSLLVPND